MAPDEKEEYVSRRVDVILAANKTGKFIGEALEGAAPPGTLFFLKPVNSF
jgi:hypothetical protein